MTSLGNLAKAFNHLGEELWKNSLIQNPLARDAGSEVLDMIAADLERVWLKGHRNEGDSLFCRHKGVYPLF